VAHRKTCKSTQTCLLFPSASWTEQSTDINNTDAEHTVPGPRNEARSGKEADERSPSIVRGPGAGQNHPSSSGRLGEAETLQRRRAPIRSCDIAPRPCRKHAPALLHSNPLQLLIQAAFQDEFGRMEDGATVPGTPRGPGSAGQTHCESG